MPLTHEDFKLTDELLDKINRAISRHVQPGEQNDGMTVKFEWWILGRSISVSHSGSTFEYVEEP
jgi:hypothetical protein